MEVFRVKLRSKITRSITQFYPFYSGCGSFANSTLLKKLSGYDESSYWTKVKGGFIFASLTDYVGRAAFFVGDLDRKITWICERIVRDGDIVLDIGANIGLITVLMSDLVGKNGHVHSFEPNPNLVQQLNETKQKNGIDNLKIHPFALGANQETLELIVPKGNKGAASLLRNSEIENNCETFKVSVKTLDSIIHEENIDSIRLIKIDVEGFEKLVFDGAEFLLETIRPDAILFELNEFTGNNVLNDPIFNLFKNYNYEFFTIPKSILQMKLKKIDSVINPQDVGHDFLACPKEKTEEISRLIRAVN